MRANGTIIVSTVLFFVFVIGCAYVNLPFFGSQDPLEATEISDEKPKTTGSQTPQVSEEKQTGSVSSKSGQELITISSQKDYGTAGLPDPLILPIVDIKEKIAYIENAKEILKLFRKVTNDNRKNAKSFKIEELRREASKYINMFVRPVIDDFAVSENFKTKFEIAKLHLLAALIYSDVGEYVMTERFIHQIDRRYGKDEFLLGLSIDPADIGYDTLSEGIKDLKRQISSQTSK